MTSYLPIPHQHFLKQGQRRQNVVFTSTGAVMLALALISLFILTGLIPVPFVNNFFRGTKYAAPGTIPCPAEGATSVDPSTTQVQILNTTSYQSLAGEATTLFVSAGYEPPESSNASPEYTGVVQIDVGPATVDEAYTIARLFSKSKVVLSEPTDKTVTVLLEIFYDSSPASDKIGCAAESKDPLKGPSGCLPPSEESLKKAKRAAARSGPMEGQSDANLQSGN